MNCLLKTSRRKFIGTGLGILTASSVSASSLLSSPKEKGEVRVLFLFGDYWHDSITMEKHWRRILGNTGWRLLFAQSSQFVTPEILSQTDLFIFCRYSGADAFGWTPDGIIENRPAPSPWMTDEQEEAIIKNVERGMGLIPFHCAIFNDDKKKYMELLGVKQPYIHGNIRWMTSFYGMNQEHPITKGVEPFEELDEIFGADMNDVKYDLLFQGKQVSSQEGRVPTWATEFKVKIDPVIVRPGGWTREIGNGRVVYLNCGSTQEVYWRKSMKELMWRSAHWAMKKEIPPVEFVEGYTKDRKE